MLFQYTVDFNDEREKLDWDTIEEFIDKWVAEHFLKDPLEEWNPYPQSDER